MKLTHIINPVKVPPSSDLFAAQPITFETMRRARKFAQDGLNVKLLSVQYPEDWDVVPDGFVKTPDVMRSFRDVANLRDAKKLPLVKDILQSAFDNSDTNSYLIYSNVDIAVQSYFYDFVYSQIKKGHDAFVINRRTISVGYTKIEEVAQMYSETGKAHPGYDCFIFHKSLLPQMILNDLCVGAVGVGLGLFVNLYVLSDNFEVFNKEHLTFHIGDDKNWKNQTVEKNHNLSQLGRIIYSYKQNRKLAEAFRFHESKLNENGFHFTFNWHQYLNEQ